MVGLDIMAQVQEMQNKLAALQEELGKKNVTASSGGGMVTVTATGRQEITAIHIDKTLFGDNDMNMLEDLVQTAVNEALRRSRDLMGQEMRAITGGISIPGLF
ncbi:nucleoid-associated protein [Deltaproteobacteria bacterium]|nr:nucleoid-associated protein [Deltaproteobacteria bacterium]